MAGKQHADTLAIIGIEQADIAAAGEGGIDTFEAGVEGSFEAAVRALDQREGLTPRAVLPAVLLGRIDIADRDAAVSSEQTAVGFAP
ncbi:MAG: hypothetical protein VX796_05730 [Pseudomonadota bacterium]|nr:hypothetical protein [Pseudomonadota bacterium]